MSGYQTVEAIDGTMHERTVHVLAEGYGICRRVPAYPNDSRFTICLLWRDRWVSEHAAIGTEDALRNRIAVMVAEGNTTTADTDIADRADRFKRRWAEADKRERAAVEKAAATAAVHMAERDRILSLPLKTRRCKVSVMTNGEGMDKEDGYLTACGTWSIRKLGDVWRISYEPMGLGLGILDRPTLKEARGITAAIVASGTHPETDKDAFQKAVLLIREAVFA